MQKISQKFSPDITLVWIPDTEIEKYTPYNQVYGTCFNPEGKILIINEGKDWKIPGGTPEENETPEETLIREVKEEASIIVTDIFPLGVQLVKDKQNQKKYYQYRYIGLIQKVLLLSPDPTTGKINKRKFVDPSEINNFVKWGKIGEAMFQQAVQMFKSTS